MKSLKSKFALLLLSLILVPLLSTAAQAETPWLGIYMQNVNDELAEAFDLKVDKGVLINDVVYGSPAQKAGIERGDVILSWNDQQLRDTDRLADLVASSNVGDKVDLLVLRDGAETKIPVEIGEQQWPHDKNNFNFDFRDIRNGGIGVSLQALTGDLGEYFGIEDGEGALITEVHEDTPAEEAGLKVGDVIVAVDGYHVDSPSEVRDRVAEHREGEEVELTIVRDRAEQTFSMEVEDLGYFGGGNWFKMPNMPNLRGFDRFHNVPNFHGFGGEYPGYRSEDFENQMEKLELQLREMERKLERLEEKLD